MTSSCVIFYVQHCIRIYLDLPHELYVVSVILYKTHNDPSPTIVKFSFVPPLFSKKVGLPHPGYDCSGRLILNCLLLTTKVTTGKETGIPWLSDNQIRSCSYVIRKFAFWKKTKSFLFHIFHFFIRSLTLSFITSTSSVCFRENKGFMLHTFEKKSQVSSYNKSWIVSFAQCII